MCIYSSIYGRTDVMLTLSFIARFSIRFAFYDGTAPSRLHTIKTVGCSYTRPVVHVVGKEAGASHDVGKAKFATRWY